MIEQGRHKRMASLRGPGTRDYKPQIYLQDRARVLLCRSRNREVPATPEEAVRQLILHWLLAKQRFEHSRIRVEEFIPFTIGKQGRADIVVYNDRNQPSVVVECKCPGGTGYEAEQQAIRYANKLGARHAWITDGTEHKALVKGRNGTWRQADRLPLLRRFPTSIVHAPPLRCSEAEMKEYVRHHGLRVQDRSLIRFAVAIYRIIFANSQFATLPYSWRGLHILEDRGYSNLSIKTPGGPWDGFYRVLRVATEGRVETVALGVNDWINPDDSIGLRLFVGVLSPPHTHHALQLDVGKYCDFREDGGFDVFHDGRFGGRSKPKEFILETVREAGRDDLFRGNSARPLHLGLLPGPRDLTWLGTRKFLANLLHYAMLRHSIRRAHPYSNGA